jgi:transposase
MGPLSTKVYAGKELVKPRASEGKRAERAKHELCYDRTEKSGYVFGALQPATGEALIATSQHRSAVNIAAFLEQIEAWIPAQTKRVYAILDNLTTHKAHDILLFALANPRWEFVFQHKYAVYLNLIEPWWKILKSSAFEEKTFETWEEKEATITPATDYWNKHKHPYVWGSRRRHRPPRKPGIACAPYVASP